MHLTLHTDYALRTLIFLAVLPDRLGTVHEVATAYAISENHLTKVVHRLGLLGYIETVRGRRGGIRLSLIHIYADGAAYLPLEADAAKKRPAGANN